MKKQLILVLLATLAISSSAQQRNDFIRFNIGSDFSEGYGAKVEYGKSYNWLELSLSLSFYNSLPLKSDYMALEQDEEQDIVWGKESNYNLDGKLNLSFMLNASVDVINLLIDKESKHALKLGIGVGPSYCHHRKNVFQSAVAGQKRIMAHDMTFEVFDYAFKASYEYAISKKAAIGAYFEMLNLPEKKLFGISIKRSF
ncbi:hypothetical protein D0T50_04550 [Bacteroides sp. 214]|uniref:hypothetical protein n=1 Tax=Bacteroides sp. 214 TaxID=2302935 RepID=UPI0013D89948|nr:hypothetical protein [Bacteroides sp. 214]NDW12160.1 hypothetical protein [Bacteroides sp. 214]